MATIDNFDARTVEPNEVFEPIPAGMYLATIVKSESKRNKNDNGSYLEFTLQVLEGEYRDRLLWDRLNIAHPNATTVKMARGSLSAICRAVGVFTPKDTIELHNIPLLVDVRLKKRGDTGEMTNEIKGYRSRDDAAKPKATADAPNTPPWKRG